MTEPRLIVTCDGACRRGIGGYGYVVQGFGKTEHILEGSGVMQEEPTTNQRAELMAAIVALQAVAAEPWEQGPPRITVVSDSAYLVNCFRDRWHVGWMANGWIASKGGPVKNRDLWESLIPLVGPLVVFRHVRGHLGHPANEFCDEAASRAIDDLCLDRRSRWDEPR